MQDIHEAAFTYTLRRIIRNRDKQGFIEILFTFLGWFSSIWLQRKLETKQTGLFKVAKQTSKKQRQQQQINKQTNKKHKTTFNFSTLLLSASNAGSELYISTDETAAGKTTICLVGGGFPSEPYEYDRYDSIFTIPSKEYKRQIDDPEDN